ncbi:SET and MYND domain-containing protein 4-like [Oppia nitens]|uniref:SET and MYND domain-containing protein 4-like n=1 Tax=Oppia nitens TaxID=1686743 RepID=UPI0023DBE6BE|nr:SET and MYND domain-containing protein 4-like [Oppia nitens]
MSDNTSNDNAMDDGWDQFAKFAVTLKYALKSVDNFDDQLFIDGFKTLTEDERRVKYCIDNKDVFEEIQRVYEDMIQLNAVNDNKNCKCVQKSQELLRNGSESFKNGMFAEAIQNYCDAICLAPIPREDSPQEEWNCLCLAFLNRSQVFYRVEDYESCLTDIEESVKYNCPIVRKHEILLRKAWCLTSLDRKSEAHEVVHELRQHLTDHKLDDNLMKEVENDLNKLMIDLNLASNDETNDGSPQENDEVIGHNEGKDEIETLHSSLLNASVAIDLNYSDIKSRFMTANRDITFGDVLIVEKPFATYLYNDKYDNYCHHCLSALDNRLIPCYGCNSIRFCSEFCRETAWNQYHKSECKSLYFLSKEIGILYIVLRILLRTGIQESIKIAKEISKNTDITKDMKQLYSCDYSSVYRLQDHKNDHNFESKLSYAMSAVFILVALENNGHISKSDDNYHYLGQLIFKHIQQLSTNLISVLDQNFCDEVNKFGFDVNEEIVGTALYPTICLLNHSCQPNVLTFFNGSNLIIKAAKNIKADEEINYCYGPNFQRMSRRDRQSKLKYQYFFDCQCFVCENRKENLTRALLCLQCNGAVIHNEDMTSECLNCKSTGLDVRKALENVEQGLIYSSKGIDFLNNQKLTEALINLSKSDELLTYNLYIQNRLLCKSKDDLCRCYALMGHFDRAVRYCEQSVKITSLIFSEQSTELLMELMKLISLKWELVDETTGMTEKKQLAKELLDVIKRTDNIVSKFKITVGFENAFQSELQFLNEKRLSVLHIV